MAYNPFNFFRSYQKAIFSVITVVIMFVFILQFGSGSGGDFFTMFPEWLRENRARGETLAVIDGGNVKESKVQDLRRTRMEANLFMAAAQVKAEEGLGRFVRDNMKKVSPDNQTAVRRAVVAEQELRTQLPQIQQMIRQNPQFAQFFLPRAEAMLEESTKAHEEIQKLSLRTDLKGDDREVIEAVRKGHQIRMTASPDRHYFADAPNKTNRDCLEFLLWLKKADQLGIRFRHEDVDALVRQEFLQFPDADREATIKDMMAEKRGAKPLTRDKLYQALADEFKVRAAMDVVLGPADTRGFEGMNPFAFYDFFRTETSYARYGVVGIPVDNYMDQVAGEPSEAEVRRLFEQARGIEPNPSQLKGGLMEPRRLKLAYIEATGKEPFYAAAGADVLLKGEAHARLSTLLTVPVGGGTAALFAAPTVLAMPEPALQESYARYKESHRTQVDQRWFPQQFGIPRQVPVDADLFKPEVLFATVGLGASPFAPLVATTGFFHTAALYERDARLKYGMPMVLPTLLDGPSGLANLTAAFAIRDLGVPKPLPLEAAKPVLAKALAESTRFRVCQNDLDAFVAEWTTLSVAAEKPGADKEKAHKEIQEYVAKFAGTQPWKDKEGKDQQGRGLKLGASADFHDPYSLAADPGLAPLLAAWKPADSRTYQEPSSFAVPFFLDPMNGRPAEAMYAPVRDPFRRGGSLPSDLAPSFIVWRTAEQPSQVPSFPIDDKTRAKVVALWKRQKARELAKAAADKLAAEFDGKLGGNVAEIGQRLTSARTAFAAAAFPGKPQLQEKVTQFEIPDPTDLTLNVRGVGTSMINDFNMQTGRLETSLKSFEMKPNAQVPYPTQKMFNELVGNRNKPLSSAFVLTDNPENTVYVAVLEEHFEDGPLRFKSVAYSIDPQRPNSAYRTLNERFLAATRLAARQTAVEMLKTEFGYEKEAAELDKKSADGG